MSRQFCETNLLNKHEINGENIINLHANESIKSI